MAYNTHTYTYIIRVSNCFLYGLLTSNSFDLVFQEFSSGGAFVFERIYTFCVSRFVFLFFFFYCVLFPIIHLLRNIELLRTIIMFNGDYAIEKSLFSFMIGNFFNLFQPQTKYSFFFSFCYTEALCSFCS